jgi:hypothetical protein
MLCSGSGGTESKSWGSFLSSVLISSPHYRASEAESSAGKVPCCPAALLGCRKCKKDQAAAPPHRTTTSAKPPIPQNGRIMLPAQSSALPVSANKPFFPSVLFRFPSSSSCMSSTHAEVMTPSSNGFVSGCYELFPVWRKWGQPRLSGALESYQII